MFTQVPTVVAPEHDDGISSRLRASSSSRMRPIWRQQAYAGSIAVFQLPSISGIFQSHLRMMAILLHQLKTRMIGRRVRFITPMSLRNILLIVEIEILFRCPERQVRFRKADRKKERLVAQGPQGLDDGVGHGAILVCGIGQIETPYGRTLRFSTVVLELRMITERI